MRPRSIPHRLCQDVSSGRLEWSKTSCSSMATGHIQGVVACAIELGTDVVSNLPLPNNCLLDITRVTRVCWFFGTCVVAGCWQLTMARRGCARCFLASKRAHAQPFGHPEEARLREATARLTLRIGASHSGASSDCTFEHMGCGFVLDCCGSHGLPSERLS